jgi:uncharacterized RDD family membrane protein YckC/tRNA A-37 threonylcarbamoyl transferase component Bud32
MNTIKICPGCGTPLPQDAPAGLCPKCLLATDPSRTRVVSEAELSNRRVPVPGQEFGHYRIVRLLGQGGMGEVYEAEDVHSGRRVALKVMSHALATDADRKRFLREGRLAAAVNHPNVVYVHGSEEIDSAPVIAMELVHGGTLHDQLKRRGPLPVAEAVEAILQVIEGLEAAHNAGVLHRDIKPSNCFFTADGSVKVGDFGLSVSTLARGESLLTAAGSVLGTPAYASPEQLRGEELDVRSDIYSVGASVYHLLTGKTPYTATEFVKLITEVLEKKPAPPSALRQEIQVELSKVVLRCLAKDRAARFQSYADLREALLPFSAVEVVPAKPARRVLAGIIDDLFAYGPSFLFLTYWSFDPLDYFVRERTATAALVWAAFYSWYFVYFGIAEGLWGAAVGKTICGLRVVGRNGHAPGIARAFLRVAIYVLPTIIPSLLYFALVSHADMRASLARGDELITDWLWWPPFLLLFITMRKRNGYAAIHDLLSGTRVVVRPRTQVRPGLAKAEITGEAAGVTSFGPYEVRSSLWRKDGEELLLAFDPALRRNVWIHFRPAASSILTAARRDLSRPARLRWLNGGQTESNRWDAYEAVDGVPLLGDRRESRSWSAVRFWLLDLAQEIATGIEDPATAPVLVMDRVWLSASGRALILDFAGPGVSHADAPRSCRDVAEMQSFLSEIARVALGDNPAPPDAQSFLAALSRRAFEKPEFIIGNLSHLVTKPAEVTRGWRAMSLVFLPACFALLGILAAGLLNFERIRTERAWRSLYPGRPLFHHAAYTYVEQVEDQTEGKDMSEDLLLARAYLLNHFSDVITNQTFWSNPTLRAGFGASEERMIKAALAAPPPEPKIAQEAERVVPKWIRKKEAQERRIPIGVFLGVLLFGPLWVALMEFIGSGLFRRSPALSLFGIAVVDRTGQLASRGRLLWRWTIAWLPVAAVLFVASYVLVVKGTLALLGAIASVLGVLAIASLAAITVFAILHPSRGLPDRLAGTALVPK